MASVAFASKKYDNAYKVGLDRMKHFVEVTLNEQWQKSNNIRWEVVPQQILKTTGSGDDRRVSTKTFYHISAAPLAQPTPQVIIQPMIQGVQGQQMMMVNGQQMMLVPAPAAGQQIQVVTAGETLPIAQEAPPQYVLPATGISEGERKLYTMLRMNQIQSLNCVPIHETNVMM